VGQGGYLVYVVCTFNPDETKHIVSQFLEKNQEYEELKLAGPVKPADFGGFFTDGDIMYIAVMRRI
jgi:16S rRNA C967 or C1407 C5-methylase (RsmB/RsmF family)